MEDPIEEWKEWISLKPLTEKIPQQFQHGLSIAPLSLTCMDAYTDHLVVGTNAGLVYLIHLPSYNIIKLKCENVFASLNTVAVVSSVDDMVAAGCCKGSVTIFQIPKVSSSKFTLSQGGNAQSNKSELSSPKRFTLKVHQNPITCLVWSRNSMKLFSGDTEGNVYLVDIDYERSECTGRFLLKVESRVVQLSYTHQMLAVSYKERCIIYDCRKDIQISVGKKPRNPPGFYGCAFSSSIENPQEDILYCARPNHKIWSANSEGVVLFSYIQQKVPENSKINLIDVNNSPTLNVKFSFGLLYNYKKSTLVSQSENCLIILNVSTQKVLGYCCDFQRICDVAVTDDCVFVLENNRSIICLSPYQPLFGNHISNPLMSSVHLPLQENLNLGSFYEIKAKMPFPNKNLIDNITKFGETMASKLSEITSPNIIPGNMTQDNESRSQENHFRNNEEFRPRPYFLGMASGAALHAYQNSQQGEKLEKDSDGRNTDETNDVDKQQLEIHQDTNREERSASAIVVLPTKKKTKKKAERKLNDCLQESQVREFNMDSRTYEDFKDTIEENESLLADVLNLSCLKMDHETKSDESDCDRDRMEEHGLENNLYYEVKEEEEEEDEHCYLSGVDEEQNISKELSYGPPSGSSAFTSLEETLVCQSSGHCNSTSLFKEQNLLSPLLEEKSVLHESNTMPPPEELPWNWHKHHLPAKPQAFVGFGNSICLTEYKDLYFSNDFFPNNEKLPLWKRKRLLTDVYSLYLRDKKIVFQTKQGSLLSVDSDTLTSMSSIQVCSEIEKKNLTCASFDQNVLWTLHKNGKVFCRNLNDESPCDVKIACQELRLTDLICRAGVVWGITQSGRIAYRIGVRPNLPCGIDWGIILHPSSVRCIHLSENGLGWMMDDKGNLYVSLFVSQSYPQGLDGKWWQIGMSDYMLDESTSHPREKWEDENHRILMTSNEHYLWVSQTDSPYAYTHSIRAFVGHRWERLSEDRFVCVCGEGVFKDFGILYCLDESGILFAVSPNSDRIVPIDLPNRDKLVSISSRPESLWALTQTGKIFIRTGLSSTSVLGSKWVKLDLHQIDDVQLAHISLSTEVVWAVDSNGQVYIRQGPISAPSPKRKGLDPAWLHVDAVELKGEAVFEKVYVGNKSHLVWGIDSTHKVYVREAIFPELSTGTSWVLVPGILAQSLSISEDKVFAVTPILHESASGSSSHVGGLLFEREGISSTNYIGDSWKRIPLHSLSLTDVAVSVDNCLWGLEKDGTLFRHSTLPLFDIKSDENLPPAVDAEGVLIYNELDDWEII